MNIKIKNAEASAEISTRGAELQSFKNDDGVEYLWQGNPDYWTGRAPVLFPCVGGLRNGKTIIDGVEYEMKRHGIAKFSEFEGIKLAENKAEFILIQNDETYKQYPFKFEFKVIYTLNGKTLNTEFVVKSLDEKPMPFALGGHPAFNCPVLGSDKFEDGIIRFSEKETVGCHRVNMDTGLIHFDEVRPFLNNEDSFKLEHSLFYQDALVFTELKSKEVTLTSTEGKHGVTLSFEQFPMLGIWSALKDGPFIALEPWAGCATCTDESDNFREKRHMKELNKDEVYSISFDVTIF